jgi:hypothetical protein
MSVQPTPLWSREDVKRIYHQNLYLSQTEQGYRKLGELRNFSHEHSLIWLLEIFQSAIKAGAQTVLIRDIPGEGFLITHDNHHRPEQGITLEELEMFCGLSTSKKTLTAVGLKSIFYFFKIVSLVTVSALSGSVRFDVGGEFPLQRSDFLKAILPSWIPGEIQSKTLLNTSFLLIGCRFSWKVMANAIACFLSASSVLRSVLRVYGLDNIQYFSGSVKLSGPLIVTPPQCPTFVVKIPWRPSVETCKILQSQVTNNSIRYPSSSSVSGFVKLPLSRNEQPTNLFNDSFVFSTFPTLDMTGLPFSMDGPFLLDANRFHVQWENGFGQWNTDIISHCLPEFICQFASWLPSYLRTLQDATSFRNELHEGINIIFSWGKKQHNLDVNEAQNRHGTLLDAFQSPHEKKKLCGRLCKVPFLPLSCGSDWNQVTWVSLQEVIWPIEKNQSSPIANSWFASLPHAHHLCPCLPILDDSQMKLIYSLATWIPHDLLRFDSSYLASMMWLDLNQWYSSFETSQENERNSGLQQLWKLCKGDEKETGLGLSMLPCVPTQRFCFGERKSRKKTFRCLHEEFYLIPNRSSQETSQWLSLIQQCLDDGTFEYHQVSADMSDQFSKWIHSDPGDSWFDQILTRDIFSLQFINRLLHSVENESTRFSLALEFVLQKRHSCVQFWSIDSSPTTGYSIVEVSCDSLLSPFPQKWLPTPELHFKYSQMTHTLKRFSIDSRLADALLSEAKCSELKKSCLGGLFQFLIQRCSESPLKDRQDLLLDWKLLNFAKEMKGDLLPYLLVHIPMDQLKQTFYRNSDSQVSPTAVRPSQWVREISCFLPQWRLIPSLTGLCQELEAVCAHEIKSNFVSILKSLLERSQRLHLPSLEELHRRDVTMRSWFTNRDWVANAEYQLKRSFVSSSLTLLPEYPLLIDDEWEIRSNRSEFGKGDLLFCSSDGKYVAVVELKASTWRSPSVVKDQARKYANLFNQLYDVKGVRGYTVWTTSPHLITSSCCPDPVLVCSIGEDLPTVSFPQIIQSRPSIIDNTENTLKDCSSIPSLASTLPHLDEFLPSQRGRIEEEEVMVEEGEKGREKENDVTNIESSVLTVVLLLSTSLLLILLLLTLLLPSLLLLMAMTTTRARSCQHQHSAVPGLCLPEKFHSSPFSNPVSVTAGKISKFLSC